MTLPASAVSLRLIAASASAVPLGTGDRPFPHLGDPGYDVMSYDTTLGHPGRNDRPLRAVTVTGAHLTTGPDRINPDFAHRTVHSAVADGGPAGVPPRRTRPDRPPAAPAVRGHAPAGARPSRGEVRDARPAAAPARASTGRERGITR